MKSRISRRNFLKASALTGSGLVVPSFANLAASGLQQGNMATDQVVRIGFKGNTANFDPAQNTGYGNIIPLVFMPPFGLDLDRNVTPNLCTHYDLSEDRKVYRLHVHPDATWSDGSAVTAQDVVDWFVYVTHPEGNPTGYRTDLSAVTGYQSVFEGESREFAGIEAVDEKTVRIELEEVDPVFWFNVLTPLRFGVAKAEQAFANPTGWWLDSPLVNGPFDIDLMDHDGGQFAVQRREDFWGPAPTVERIEWNFVPDGSTLGLLWENGEVDISVLFAEQETLFLQTQPEAAKVLGRRPLHRSPYLFWSFNVNKAPTDDIMVRRALTHAVDTETIVEALFEGRLPAHRGPIDPTAGEASRYDTIRDLHEMFIYDPELARQELAESSYGSAENLPTINMTSSASSGDRLRATEIVAEQWRQNLGITNVDIRPSGDDFGSRQEVNFYRISGGGRPDAGALLTYYIGGFAESFMGGWEDQEFIDLATEAYFMDREDPEFIPTLHAAEDIMLEQFLYVPMWQVESYHWVQPWLQNFEVPYNAHYDDLGKTAYLEERS